MRWFVEVSWGVDESTFSERYCVEAKAWQAALQSVRKLRGDSGPLSKFSIELLVDGYRAVDPVRKTGYVVSQAPSDAPLALPTSENGAGHVGPGSTVPPAMGSSDFPVVDTAVAVVPPSAASVRALVGVGPVSQFETIPTTPVPATPGAKKVMAGARGSSTGSSAPSLRASGTAVRAAPSVAPRPAAPCRSASPRASGQSPALDVKSAAPAVSPVVAHSSADVALAASPPAAFPVVAHSPATAADAVLAASPPAAVQGAKLWEERQERPSGLPEFEVFSSRSQAPTAEVPISYREIACVVAPGTPREAVEALLRARFEAARAELAASPWGQLIQIGVFDHVFDARPQRAPLGTLAWKDWRGEAVLAYPAFGEAALPISPSLPPIPMVSVSAAPTVSVVAEPAPVPAAGPLVAPSLGAQLAPAPAPTEEPEPAAPSARPASHPDSERSSQKLRGARRRAGEDLIGELFESMHELHFASDIVAGADFLLGVLQRALPCEATLIQVFDINTRAFVAVRGRGAGVEHAVLHRTPDHDSLIFEVMRRQRSSVYRPEQDSRFASGRWGKIGLPLGQILCGPVRQGGRYLGMIELANPAGGTPFHEAEINALDYICEQFADFVASRPVVLDADVILGR